MMEASPTPSDKTLLRRQMSARRRAFQGTVREEEEAACLDRMRTCFNLNAQSSVQSSVQSAAHSSVAQPAPDPSPALCVAGYMADDGELNVAPILLWLQTLGCRLALPSAHDEGALIFREWDGTSLVTGRYGIKEATGDPCEPDLILVPLLACDDHGARLGRGGGYYDQWLASRGTNVYRLGVAFSFQCVDTVPVEAHDQRLDGILSAKGFRQCRPHPHDARLWL